MGATDFDLTLIDPNPALCEEFELHFKRFDRVRVVCDRFENLPAFDCMVSAANSFGLMDGGVDLAITSFFGVQLMDRVQARILQEFRGEQPVGTSFIIETGNDKHPYLAHTPTMRVPMPISATDNVYCAMWAMLLAVGRHNVTSQPSIKVVACPGLGTATGRVPFRAAASQMSYAYSNFLHPPTTINWPYASARQTGLGRGGDQGFKKLTTTR